MNVLVRDAIRLGSIASSRDDAILQAGRALEETGAVDPGYADAMLERERGISTSVGEGFAIPHGTDESRVLVRRTALSFIQFPAGVDWDADRVYVCIGIAARDDAHLGILAQLADTLIEPELAARLREATDPDEVLAILEPALDQDGQGEPPAGDQP
ncbi:MAG TPA: PTS sugar transporter subunit IIA [Candidatus Limnocylindrales bacterium]